MTPRWCEAAVLVISRGDRRPLNPKEVHRVPTETTHQLLPLESSPGDASGAAEANLEASMKTIAARFDDPLFELLSLVAQLEDTSIVDQIRQAVEAHIARKVQEGDLASRAEAAAEEIDREAEAKKAAIAGLVGAVNESVGSQPKKKAAPRRRAKADPVEEPSEPEARANPIGFAPPRKEGRQ